MINDVDPFCVEKAHSNIILSDYVSVIKSTVDVSTAPLPLPSYLASMKKIIISGPPYGVAANRDLPSTIIDNLLDTLDNVILAVFILPKRCHVEEERDGFDVTHLTDVDNTFHKPFLSASNEVDYESVRQPTVIRVYKSKNA